MVYGRLYLYLSKRATRDSIGTAFGFRSAFPEREGDGEFGAGLRAAVERAAEYFDALAHAAQSVAFVLRAAAAVVFDLEPARTVALFQTQRASASMGVAHYVGDGFPDSHRQHAFLERGKLYAGGLAFYGDARGFERGPGLREFGRQSLRAVAADGVANFRQCLAGNLFDLADLDAYAEAGRVEAKR